MVNKSFWWFLTEDADGRDGENEAIFVQTSSRKNDEKGTRYVCPKTKQEMPMILNLERNDRTKTLENGDVLHYVKVNPFVLLI